MLQYRVLLDVGDLLGGSLGQLVACFMIQAKLAIAAIALACRK